MKKAFNWSVWMISVAIVQAVIHHITGKLSIAVIFTAAMWMYHYTQEGQ